MKAKIYANRIMTSNGTYTIDDVPADLRDEVMAILVQRGYM